MAKASKIGSDGVPIKRSQRSRKDPRAPKRSKSAYIFFAMDCRESVKGEIGPDARVGDIAKLTSQRWKALTDHDRLRWETLSRADRDRYQDEKASYTGPLLLPPTEKMTSSNKKVKNERDPAAPKRPLTAFLYFSQQMRPALKEQNPRWGIAELSQELGRRWREMSDEQRSPYAEHAVEVKEKWREESSKYKEDQQAILAKLKEEEAVAKQLREQQKKILKTQAKQEKQQRKLYEEQQAQRELIAMQQQQRQVAPLPPQQEHHHHGGFNVHDMYRQQQQQVSNSRGDDPYAMNMGAQYGGSALAGMLAQQQQQQQQQDIQGMIAMGYPGAAGMTMAGAAGPSSYPHPSQAGFYGGGGVEHSAANRYSGYGTSMAGMGELSSMGGGLPPSMGLYGYGGSGMMMDPSTGYGYMGGM